MLLQQEITFGVKCDRFGVLTGVMEQLPNLVTPITFGDDFYAMCVEDERQWAEGVAVAAERRIQQESHVAALVAWKKDCDGIRDRNREKKMEYDTAVIKWEAEKAAAKLEQRRPGWPKPKWKKDYEPEVMLERPKKSVDDDDDESDNGNDGDGDDD